MADLIQKTITFIFGAVFVVTICGFIYKRHAEEWEVLAGIYGRSWKKPIAVKKRRSMVLYAKGKPARTYAGILTIGVYSDGIGLKPIRWLAPFHRPIFVPFTDIEGWQQRWYWDAKSVELSFVKAPSLRTIMPSSQIAWVSAQGAAGIDISPDKPDTGNWPYATQLIAIVALLQVITLCVFLYVKADGDWAQIWSMLGPNNRGQH